MTSFSSGPRNRTEPNGNISFIRSSSRPVHRLQPSWIPCSHIDRSIANSNSRSHGVSSNSASASRQHGNNPRANKTIANFRQQDARDPSDSSSGNVIISATSGLSWCLPAMPSEGGPPAAPQPQPVASNAEQDVTCSSATSMPDRTHLLEVHIQNFALVEEQAVQFGPGLNVVTGESGSGKSVLVEAVHQLLGGPAPAECIREPAVVAVVEGAFWLSAASAQAVRAALEQDGVAKKVLPPDTSCRLDIRREILRQEGSSLPPRSSPSRDGASTAPVSTRPPLRSRCYVNGFPVTLRTLRALAGLLVDMNGQHSSLALREPATQMDLLDRVGECGHLVDKVNQLIMRMSEVESKLEILDSISDPVEREVKRKLVESVRKVKVQPGEEVVLRQEVRALEARRSVAEQCAAARAALAGDGVGGGLQAGIKQLEAQLRGVMATAAASSRGVPGAAAVAGVPSRPGLAAARVRPRSSTPAYPAALQGRPGSGHTRGRPASPSSTLVTAAGGERTKIGSPAGSSSDDEEKRAAGLPILDAARIEDDGDDHAVKEEEEQEEEEEEEESGGPMEEALEALSQARQQLAVAEGLVKAYSRQSALDVHEYEEKSERLQVLEKLLRSQRCRTSEELLAAADEAETQMDEYQDMVDSQEEWEAQLEQYRTALLEAAVALSAARRAAAPQLAKHVESCLAELAMGDARVDVSVTWQHEPHASRLRECEALDVPPAIAEGCGELGGCSYRLLPSAGLDQVELRLAAGPAEPLRPLGAVASGGESARVMLALKASPTASAMPGRAAGGGGAAVAGQHTPVPTQPLSELVSGETGVGEASVGYDGAAGSGAAAAAASADKTAVLGSAASAGAGSQAAVLAGAVSQAAVSAGAVSVGRAVPSMILDELDSGIGSRLGSSVGAMLRRMASWGSSPAQDLAGSQIICVTHLPQVACYADRHIKVLKHQGAVGSADAGRVTTCFQHLSSFQDRADEVADMLGIDLSVAEDMLLSAQPGMVKGSSRPAGQRRGPMPASNNLRSDGDEMGVEQVEVALQALSNSLAELRSVVSQELAGETQQAGEMQDSSSGRSASEQAGWQAADGGGL